MTKPVTFAMAVWGQWHADIFCNLLARSLIADGNFPSLKGRKNLRYLIYTDRQTVDRMERSAVWKTLKRNIEVDVRLTDILYERPIDAHHLIWAKAKSDAEEFGGALVFVAPDTIWANGSIKRIVDLFDAGYGGIFFPGFRVAFDTFMPAMAKLYGGASGPISLKPTELMAHAMQHMHPLKTVFLRNSPTFPDFSENMLWPVGDEGFVLREPLAHSLMAVDPSLVEINEHSVPIRKSQLDKIYWSEGSDDILFASLGPLGRDLGWFDTADAADSFRIGFTSKIVDGTIVDTLIRRRFRFHRGITDEARWRAAERASDLFMHRAIATREGIKIFGQLERNECSRGAAILAAAFAVANLTHAVTFKGPITIFCPDDSSLPKVDDGAIGEYLASWSERELRRFILAHAVEGKFSLATLSGMNGKSLPGNRLFVRRYGEHVTVNEVPILKSDIGCGDHIIHVVGAPLVREERRV
jgi:hypothetical protein